MGYPSSFLFRTIELMKKHAPLLFGVLLFVLCYFTGVQAGIIPAIIPAAVPTASITAAPASKTSALFVAADSSENVAINGALSIGTSNQTAQLTIGAPALQNVGFSNQNGGGGVGELAVQVHGANYFFFTPGGLILSSSGQTWLADGSNGQLKVGKAAGGTNGIVLAGSAGFGTTSPGAILDVSGGQIRTSGTTPSIGNNACGSTTQGTVSGTDVDGLVTVGTATVTACTISLSQTYTNAFRTCILYPANSTAAAANTVQAYVSSITTSQWVITGLALASAAFYYHCE